MSDYQTIDIRSWKVTGDELKKEIVEAVKDTQRVIIRELPNKLLMTVEQYDMLQPDPDMRGFGNSKERVYMTTENAMDVIVSEV